MPTFRMVLAASCLITVSTLIAVSTFSQARQAEPATGALQKQTTFGVWSKNIFADAVTVTGPASPDSRLCASGTEFTIRTTVRTAASTSKPRKTPDGGILRPTRALARQVTRAILGAVLMLYTMTRVPFADVSMPKL